MTNRYGSEPLGKSVEEVESESGNLVNSPVEGEQIRQADTAGIPAVIPSNGAGVPAIVNPGALIEPGSGAYDGTANTGRDTTEE